MNMRVLKTVENKKGSMNVKPMLERRSGNVKSGARKAVADSSGSVRDTVRKKNARRGGRKSIVRSVVRNRNMSSVRNTVVAVAMVASVMAKRGEITVMTTEWHRYEHDDPMNKARSAVAEGISSTIG